MKNVHEQYDPLAAVMGKEDGVEVAETAFIDAYKLTGSEIVGCAALLPGFA